MVGQMGNPADHCTLQGVTEDKQNCGGERNAEQGVETEPAKHDQRKKHSHHHNLTMSEIDDANNTKNNRKTKRGEPIDQSGQQTGC